MLIENGMDEKIVIGEIAERIRQHRIAMSMTQSELAEKSMVSLRSISRFENGEDITLRNLIRLVNALDLGGNIDLLIPDYRNRPSYHINDKTGKRKRVVRRTDEGNGNTWKWGDEQ